MSIRGGGNAPIAWLTWGACLLSTLLLAACNEPLPSTQPLVAVPGPLATTPTALVRPREFPAASKAGAAAELAAAPTATPLSTNPGAPALTLAPTLLDFSTVRLENTSVPQLLTLTNTGTASFAASSLALSISDPAFSATLEGCTAVIVAPGSTCTITVRFAPSDEPVRSYAARLTASTASGVSPPVTLRGIAVR